MRNLRYLLLFTFILLHSNLTWSQTRLEFATMQYPPYMQQTGATVQGLTIDMVNEIFSRMNQPIQYRFYPWARSLYLVENKQVDGLFTIKKTDEREQTMLFPKHPLLTQDYVFFVLKGSKVKFDGDYASLANASIGVVDRTSYGNRFDTAVRENTFKHLDVAVSYELTFKKLLAGRMDTVICSRLVGIHILKQLNGLDRVTISGPPSESAVSYLVFSRKPENIPLVEQFDKIVAEMQQDGTMDIILSKYDHQLD
ncbi:substrate-binding periplasmic protein [Shewanella electrica]|nr:transporter substrate-binding domain-containing protein [Shewanella electrica]